MHSIVEGNIFLHITGKISKLIHTNNGITVDHFT